MNHPLRTLSCALMTLMLGVPAVGGAELSVGVAVTDITPPKGYRMCGYFYERLNTGTHDPLLAKALVFRQGAEGAALVFCDIIGISPGVSRRARKLAAKKTGIPHVNILIAATHSHTGPLYFGALRKLFHDKAVAEHGSDPHEKLDYPTLLVTRIVEAILDAHGNAEPMHTDVRVGRETRLSFNRRFHMTNGPVRFNPGKMNPNIIRPAGPIDPDVTILRFSSLAGNRPVAMLTVFALHLDTVGGTEYSADFPFYLGRSLQQDLGKDFVSLFGNGTCGDINHVDVSHKRPQKGREEAKRIGTALARTVKAELPTLIAVSNPRLAVRSAIVHVPMQQYSAEQIARSAEKMHLVGTRKLPFLERVEAYKIQALQLRKGSTLPMEVQAFRLSGDVAIVGLPGEVFVELGLAIKRASPFATTLVIELCNDAPGYVPTAKAFKEGSYETVNSRIQSGGGQMLTQAAARLLHNLKTD